jgi:hypothetical protein
VSVGRGTFQIGNSVSWSEEADSTVIVGFTAEVTGVEPVRFPEFCGEAGEGVGTNEDAGSAFGISPKLK